ncbi:MAG: hypothetical protein JXD21_04365 [Candidatus Omnitrophica bacterium]|nr:hypothetical protein [Candidatus Omnitrophota bacterium]
MNDRCEMKAVFFTEKFKIEGTVYIEAGFRVSDLLNAPKNGFVPLTKVSISDWQDNLILKQDFICLNKSFILFARDVMCQKEG